MMITIFDTFEKERGEKRREEICEVKRGKEKPE